MSNKLNDPKENTPKEMRTSGFIWKELVNDKLEKSLMESSRSKSKTKKFTPMRSSTVSDLHKNIKAIASSKLNNSEIDSFRGDSEEKDVSKLMEVGYSPSKSEESFLNTLKRKEASSNAHNESSNSFTLMKHLNVLDKELKEKKESRFNKPYFSLDEEHKNMHDEINQIKMEFIKFKELVQAELHRQSEYVKVVVGRIYEEFDSVLEKCKREKIMTGLHSSFEGGRSNSHLNICESESDISEIKNVDKKFSDNKNYLQKILGDSILKFDQDQSINHKIEDLSERKASFHAQTERPRISKSEYQFVKPQIKKPMTSEDSFIKSKKEFEKLFQAVNCLKEDIKELKSLNFTTRDLTQKENGSLKQPQVNENFSRFLSVQESSIVLNKSKN